MGSRLIWLSGARPDILAQCVSERPKYRAIALTVLATSPMSAFSMGITLHAVWGMKFPVAIPFALAWGLVVMSLNRWLVVSLVRQSPWRCIIAALPRLLLGLLLGTITSVPLILGLFHSDIAFQIWVDHTRNVTAYNSSPAAASLRMPDFGTPNGILASLKALDELGSQYNFVKELAIAIFLFFTLVQWAPVLEKTLLNLESKSAYERLLHVEKKRQVTVSSGSALAEEIRRMAADAQQYAWEDHQRREVAEVRDQADTLTYQTERFLDENQDKIPEDVKAEAEEALGELKKALDGSDTEAIKDAMKRVTQVTQKMGVPMYAQADETRAAAGANPKVSTAIETHASSRQQMTPLSLSIDLKGGIFAELIKGETAVPTARLEILDSSGDNPPWVRIQVFSGEDEIAAYNKEPIGMAAPPSAVRRIEVTFDIDANGTVHVSAQEPGAGTAGKEERDATADGPALPTGRSRMALPPASPPADE